MGYFGPCAARGPKKASVAQSRPCICPDMQEVIVMLIDVARSGPRATAERNVLNVLLDAGMLSATVNEALHS